VAFPKILFVKLSSTNFVGLIFKRRNKMKNQIEILKELIREILGTISIEEFLRNQNVSQTAEELLSNLQMNLNTTTA
jgi:hypothetical protein